MGNREIEQLVGQLRDELQNLDSDAETRSLVQRLDNDIHALIGEKPAHTDRESALDRARKLEGKFAAGHPRAERLLMEIVNLLVKMGI